jgi:hypothetical protein
MKPCSKNRKLLAWLALDELDARRARELRAHIKSCDACRGYLKEISAVTERLAAAEMAPDIQASETFHQRLVARLRTEQPVSLWEGMLAAVRQNWRVALPAFCTAALVIATLSIPVRQPTVSPLAPTGSQAGLPPARELDLPPTIANYQSVANRSLDELDELLTRQANGNPPSAPIYTTSMFALASASD